MAVQYSETVRAAILDEMELDALLVQIEAAADDELDHKRKSLLVESRDRIVALRAARVAILAQKEDLLSGPIAMAVGIEMLKRAAEPHPVVSDLARLLSQAVATLREYRRADKAFAAMPTEPSRAWRDAQTQLIVARQDADAFLARLESK